MRLPIKTFLALNGYIEELITEDNPFLSKHKLEYATKSRFRSPNGYIEIQQFEGATYQILYYEMDLLAPEYFPFDFDHNNIYFRFNIEGEYILHQVENELYKRAKEQTYAPAYHAEGKHGIQFQGGVTRIFTVVFRSDWPRLNFVKNPHLLPLADIIGMATRPKTSVALMHVDISKIENHLLEIFDMTGDPAVIRAEIKKIFVSICIIYNQQVDEKLKYAWVKAETYMHDNIDEDPVTTDFFTVKYNSSNATLYRNFQEEYSNTPMDQQDLIKRGIIKRGNFYTQPIPIVKII